MKKTLWLLSGVPGSGKSTWARQKIAETESAIRVSRDDIRFNLIKDSDGYFDYEDIVISTFISDIQTAIKNEINNIYIDATHLNDKKRWKILDEIEYLASDYEVVVVIFDTPLEICIKRNNLRTGREKVPENVIRNMYKSFQKDSDMYDYMRLKEEGV